MKNIILVSIVLVLFIIGTPVLADSESSGINIHDTRMLRQGAISQEHIAFFYAGDLWVADSSGKNVRRLTSQEGLEANPVFSQDGKWIAFSGDYNGNVDVYAVPVEGGIPKRLTWHPAFDAPCSFTPDSSEVLFASTRSSFFPPVTKLFTVPLKGGFPICLEIPRANRACYSPDKEYLAYTPVLEAFLQWKHYRGGTVSRIWIYRFSDRSVEEVPQPEGKCNDTDPMWIGDKIYFRSDRNGEFNLFSYDRQGKTVNQLTNYTDYPVLGASAGAGKIIFEQAGYLHIFDPGQGKAEKLTIGVAADLREVTPRYVKGFDFVRNASISPSGARAAIEFRGEIITAPAEKGDIRYLTNTPASHEQSPAWSPDGKSIAYFSDASGEYQLFIQPQDGKGAIRTFDLKGAGFYALPSWSPDNKKIAFVDNSQSIYWINLENGNCKKIATEPIYEPATFPTNTLSWSPDSRWLAYTLTNDAQFRQVFIYSFEQDKSFPVTDGMSEAVEPVFDPSGNYLYFFASTDAGPVKHWFAMSNADMELSSSIYLVVLKKDLPSPLLKESDEEKGAETKSDDNADKDKDKKDKKGSENDKPKTVQTVIDFEGLDLRILNLPIPMGNYSSLQVGTEGNIYYLEAPANSGTFDRETQLHKFDLKKRKDAVIMNGVNAYWISADKKKILYLNFSSQMAAITALADTIKPGEGVLNLANIRVLIDPPKEWVQIFYEAWRINRDYFYDPNFHGADWQAMKKKYEVFLPHLSCRQDLNRVIQWMCSELAVGHHRIFGGDTPQKPEPIPGGLLGADYTIENNRYRFKKVYGGLNWTPELRSPLTEPGVNVKAGEYLLAVNGHELVYPDNLFQYFEYTAGKIVEIKVGPNPDGSAARTVSVVPVDNEFGLRNRDWIEGNIKKVEKATNGRVAYVYVPNTSRRGHQYFKRYFFPQTHKDAVIIDERYNGGGQVADYYIDILRRPYLCSWATRYGKDLKTPSDSIQGPKVMLINEFAGSGGDLLPWMFRKFNLGKLIGKRTWGGLVGILGFPILMDGGYVTAPNIGFWTEEGFGVENEGVAPDIEIEEWPADMINGRDPQLEKAIEIINEELKNNPPKKMIRPPFPIRVKK